MSFTTACPSCDARLQAPDTVEGKRIKCKKCGEAFVARPADEDEDDRPARSAAKSRTRRLDDDGNDRPRRSKEERGNRDDDYEDEDRPRRRRRDDEDDEPRPRSRAKGKKKAGPPVLLFVLLGVGALVLIGGAVGAYLYFSNEKSPDNPVAKSGPGPNAPAGPGPAGAVTAGWVEHNDPAGRYRVRFPTAPQSQTVTQQTPNGPVNVSLHMSGGPSEVFVSGSQPVPPEHRMGLSDDQVLDLGMEMAKMHGKGAAVRDTQSITYQGFAGRQLVMNAPGKKGSLIMRLVLTRDRLIFLMAGGDSASADAPRVKAFFESLKID